VFFNTITSRITLYQRPAEIVPATTSNDLEILSPSGYNCYVTIIVK